MEFIEGEIYRHDRSMDIDMVIRRVVDVTPKGTKLKVLWVSKQSRRFITEDEVFVTAEQYPNWKQVPE